MDCSLPGSWNTTYSAIIEKKERNVAFCDSVDGLGEGYVWWDKSDGERYTVWYHLYEESKKCNKLVNIKKKKADTWRTNKGYQWGDGREEGKAGIGA